MRRLDWRERAVRRLAGLMPVMMTGGRRIEREELGIALAKEMMSGTATARKSRRLRVGAEGSGDHDDLAVALACWVAGKAMLGLKDLRLFW